MRLRSLGVAFVLSSVGCAGSMDVARLPSLPTEPGPVLTGSTIKPAHHVEDPIVDLAFADAKHGAALIITCGEADCSSLVYSTNDGGVTWRQVAWIGDGHEHGRLARSLRTSFIFGPDLHLVRDGATDSESDHMAEIDTRAVATIGSTIWRVDVGDLCEYGRTPCGGGLLISDDEGRTWRKPGQPVDTAAVGQVLLASPTHAWVLGGTPATARIERTTDGARSWALVADPCANSAYTHARELASHDGRVLWMVCAAPPAGDVQRKVVVRSSNGGATWDLALAGPSSGTSFSAASNGSEMVWLSMKGSPLAVTSDGGRTWSARLAYRDNAEWGPIQVVGATHGWVAYGDEIFRTVDGGNTWHRVALPEPNFN